MVEKEVIIELNESIEGLQAHCTLASSKKVSRIQRMGTKLQRVWEEIPSPFQAKSETVLKQFLTKNPNILPSNFEAGINICQKRNELFFVFVFAKEYWKVGKQNSAVQKQQICALIQAAHKFNVVLLERSSKNEKYITILEKQGTLTQANSLLACRINSSQEIVVLEQISLSGLSSEEVMNLKIQQAKNRFRRSQEDQRKFGMEIHPRKPVLKVQKESSLLIFSNSFKESYFRLC